MIRSLRKSRRRSVKLFGSPEAAAFEQTARHLDICMITTDRRLSYWLVQVECCGHKALRTSRQIKPGCETRYTRSARSSRFLIRFSLSEFRRAPQANLLAVSVG